MGEKLSENIRLVDTDEENKLDLFCYVKCTDTDNDLIKKCRGVVFTDQTLVMKAFPYTLEYNNSETDKINDFIPDVNQCNIYESHEGALIRMFYFNNKWYVSTHRKLNAFKSKWASRESFGSSFKKALESEVEHNEKFKERLNDGDNILERFEEILDVKKQYMFLIRNNKDNRIVCDPPNRAILYHVGTFVDGKLLMTEDLNIPYPKKLEFTSTTDLIDYVDKISYKDIQGLICFTPKGELKIINKDYQDLFKARGNEPSIKFRYLQVRMNNRYTNMLYHLYPHMSTIFDEYENTLYDIARNIYKAYIQRFIKKRYVTVPREEFTVIRECHSWHLSNRTENRISLEQIIKILNQQSPTHLNHMIRRFNTEQIRETQITTRPRTESLRSNKSFEQSPNAFKSPNNKTKKSVNLSPLILSQHVNKTRFTTRSSTRSSTRSATIHPREKREEKQEEQRDISEFPPLK